MFQAGNRVALYDLQNPDQVMQVTQAIRVVAEVLLAGHITVANLILAQVLQVNR